ncbi:hypothetical protein AC35_2662 [Escherichia coli 3-475-03_S3_C2]|nr:hypothetical protein ECDEC8E_5314 [Escherichia coli DEC8E]EHW33853.1 hypothetical protein ECDEC9B_5137 [Escherichia coli DEC9B]EHX54566.1 hypothetical protein ECDEC13C_5240 [Escherichia coli DEC13C]EHX56911.1 hypothetical protein ECDEC13D_4950 [Escherichia coli DEC13D]KDT62528.1 hypothetical protein AB76_1932 [Escherichia coli 3-267-03_S1_C3]KEK74022.1 hypothetical protein AC07_4908 [Escherichia coli 3-475-03_S3_C1]KEK87169.1 hypothetical protein AC35_2662 [Escherichia coli 3-475-03_S3_C2]
MRAIPEQYDHIASKYRACDGFLCSDPKARFYHRHKQWQRQHHQFLYQEVVKMN